jgi:hypothetical protein
VEVDADRPAGRMTAETAPNAIAAGAEGGGGGAQQHTMSKTPHLFYDQECAKVESWLDEHPEFMQDYFLRCAK